MHQWPYSQSALLSGVWFPWSKESQSGIEIQPHSLPVLCPALLQKGKNSFASPRPQYFHHGVDLLRKTAATTRERERKKNIGHPNFYWISCVIHKTIHSLCLQKNNIHYKENSWQDPLSSMGVSSKLWQPVCFAPPFLSVAFPLNAVGIGQTCIRETDEEWSPCCAGPFLSSACRATHHIQVSWALRSQANW